MPRSKRVGEPVPVNGLRDPLVPAAKPKNDTREKAERGARPGQEQRLQYVATPFSVGPQKPTAGIEKIGTSPEDERNRDENIGETRPSIATIKDTRYNANTAMCGWPPR